MNYKKLKHLFLPHSETHQKAHLLHWHFLIIYILLFILLQAGFNLISVFKPGVLGTTSKITSQEVVRLVNIERQKRGLSTLSESSTLAVAATAKAQNMFEENYWAHFAPSGKDPWGFITASGYKFSYAGENLARSFSSTEDMVKAWMNSPSHRDNILNPSYQDIGIAVEDGVLEGQQTTLVVQMFGKPYQPLAVLPQVNLGGQKIALEEKQLEVKQPVLVAGSALAKSSLNPAPLDPSFITRVVSVILISFIALLLLADFIVLKRRGVYRISSHHLAHLSFLGLSSVSVVLSKTGEIL